MFTSTEPSALDMMRSMYVSLGDLTPTRCDAHFVHGAPAAEEHHYRRLLQTVAHHYRTRTVGASNLLDMARDRGWHNLVVSSLPHHQLRCFLQIVALIARPYWCKVYNMTIGGISLMST